MNRTPVVGVALSLTLLGGGCGTAAPTAPTPLVAPTAPSAALFQTTSAGVAGSLVLSGTATTVPFGGYTTIRVTLDPSVASLRWTFGDGQTSTLNRTTIEHWYPAEGRYHAFLTATAFDGHAETVDGFVDVLPAVPGFETPRPPLPTQNHVPHYNITLSASASTTIAVGDSLIFTASVELVDGASPPSAYRWSCFGDGTFGPDTVSATKVCTYPTVGTFVAVVNAVGAENIGGALRVVVQ